MGKHKARVFNAFWSICNVPSLSVCFLYVLMCPHIRSNIPNRSTFVCPFCGARNLDQQELVKHCMDNHRNDPNKVVRGDLILNHSARVCHSTNRNLEKPKNP